MRRCATAALAAGMILPWSALPAHASGVEDLPEISRGQLSQSVHNLDGGVHRLARNVDGLDTKGSITDLERRTGSGDIALNSDILFGFDKDTLSRRAERAVVEAVEDIPKGASVTITGYTDDVGADDYNQRLSTKRAEAVAKALTEARPDLDTTARGRGSADPVAPNTKGGEDNPEGRAQNRRVEISHE